MQITLLGKRWRLAFCSNLKDDGDCDAPETPNKTIRIKQGLDPKDELETLIHEMLHATDWHKDEKDWIEPVARDIARVLWRLGYRKQ